MADNFPQYPATSFDQAVDLTIYSSNQLGDVINGDATSVVSTESGDIPTLRKALIDNFYFKNPIQWNPGNTNTVFNQLYVFDTDNINKGWYYAPTATATNPILMGDTPVGDANWKLYSFPYTFTVDSAVDIFTLPSIFDEIHVRGFYTKNDGGQGVWKRTGVTNISLAGRHVITEAKIYNANGVEYQLKVAVGSDVDARSNGAVCITGGDNSSLISDVSAASTVCLGQAINGILYTISPTDTYSLSNDDLLAPVVAQKIYIKITGGSYRVSKQGIKVRKFAEYDCAGSVIYVYAANEYKRTVTSKWLNGFEHSYEDIDEVYAAIGQREFLGAVAVGHTKISNAKILGDHKVSLSESVCSAGSAFFLINPEYVTLENIHARGFQLPLVARPANSGVINSGLITTDLPTSSDAGVTFGNFYGLYCKNVFLDWGREGLAQIMTDWSTWEGGSLCDGAAWIEGPDAKRPDYFLVVTGAGFRMSGVNLTVSHTQISNETKRPGKGVVYTNCRGHSFTNNYLEHTPNLFVVSKQMADPSYSKALGLIIDGIAHQYKPISSWTYITFEDGCFGHYDENGNWVYPELYTENQYAYNGINFTRIGSPLHDVGAFLHGGYDFKYGTYGLYGASAGSVDFDHLRDYKETKEFISPYGLRVNSGTLYVPMHSPAYRSNICIWYKDLTGSFDPVNFVIWQSIAGLETPSVDGNLVMSRGEGCIDFGNGYKMAIIPTVKWNANDGVGTYTPQQNLVITVASGKPIVLKAIQAFTGGVPVFPTGLDYKPESGLNGVFGNYTNGYIKSPGGGLFKPGDIVYPWISVDKHTNDYKYNATLGAAGNPIPQIITSGMTLGSAYQQSFNVTVASVDSTNSRTTITVPSASLPYIAMGIPAYVASGSSTSYTGSTRVYRRVMNSDGTASNQYILDAVVGAAGDTLVINQALIPTYSVKGDVTLNNVVTSNLTSTGLFTANNSNFTGTATTRGVRPNSGATYNLGEAALPWNNIYTQNAVTVVSDRIHKPVRESIPDNILDIWGTIGIKRYKYDWAIAEKGEENARWHVGYIAQDILEAFEAAGEDATEWGLIVHVTQDAQDAIVESWDAVYETVPAEYDAEGNLVTPETQILVKEAGSVVIQEASDAIDQWRLVMDECNAMETAYQRRRLDRIEATISGSQ
ncbi:TPA: tail fiber domain-containing protein [Klebsiella pneumoniae]|nr:tail fiber domain-containing protein [Klebsiella pneumoniae]